MNRVTLMGHIGRELTIKYTDKQLAILNFVVATNDGTKDKPETNWHNCTAFGKSAEVISKYFKKGSKILLEGKLKHSSYDHKDGTKRYKTDVICDKFEFIDPKSKTESMSFPSSENDPFSAPTPDVDFNSDEIPF